MKTLTIHFSDPPEIINERGNVTWSDLQRMCQKTELSEEDVVHLALKSLLAREDSLHPPDDGPITEEQAQKIQQYANSKGARPDISSDKKLF